MAEPDDADFVNAEWQRRYRAWWYVIEEPPGAVTITLGPMSDVDDTIYLRMPLPTTYATLLRAAMAAAECHWRPAA